MLMHTSDEGHSSVETIVQGNTQFALDLYHKLRTAEGNLFFSPYSISTALAMAYAGARGDTETQMAQTLHFTLDQERLHPAFASLEAGLKAIQGKEHILLHVANALWPHVGYPFLEEFLTLMREYYGVLITPVDYRDVETARQKINAWVEQKTQEKIRDLVPPGVLTVLTRLVLVNAIYFKGNWASQFDQKLTETAPFMVTPSDLVQVPTMFQEHKFRYGESDGLQILELLYAGSDLAMLVLLPNKVEGLSELEGALTLDNLQKWTGGLRETQVQVSLPRFRVDGASRLDDVLKSMGMVDAFDELKANFAGMDGHPDWLYVAAVLHRAFVDVNEEGTEAAAATAVVMALRSMPKPPVVFRADHPFVFLIRDDHTGSILFAGRVVSPVAEAA